MRMTSAYHTNNLTGHHIGVEGAYKINEALRTNKTLKKLSLKSEKQKKKKRRKAKTNQCHYDNE